MTFQIQTCVTVYLMALNWIAKSEYNNQNVHLIETKYNNKDNKKLLLSYLTRLINFNIC